MSDVEEYKTHLFTYRHDGRSWMLEVVARDAQDAKARLAKIPYATYDGVLMAKIPAGGASWLVNAICALRNGLRRAIWRG